MTMEHGWQKLKAMTNGKSFRIVKVHIPEDGITIEGDFQLPPLGELSFEDQIFDFCRGLRQDTWVDQTDGSDIRHQLPYGKEPFERDRKSIGYRGCQGGCHRFGFLHPGQGDIDVSQALQEMR